MPDTSTPYQNPSLPVEQRVDDLLARMTRAEKIGQLNQVLVWPGCEETVREAVRRGAVGSRITVKWQKNTSPNPGVEDLNALQRVAVEESRLGIPLIHGRDIVHGFRTIFPIPLGLAASFDPELVEEAFAASALEGASAGVHWSFAPMIDISHDPRWGRIIEGFGEDPSLCGRLAAAAVRGFQGEDLSQPGRLLACAKHFIGYGAAEGGRDYETSEISENTLRNLYLPPYRAAVEAGVGSVMSSFQDLNGRPVSGSYALLTGLLKEELGFAGFVVSDWASVQELVTHRAAADERDAARQGILAGVDMDMVAELFVSHLDGLVESGEVPEARLDDACRRVLAAKFQLGLFEHPYTDPAWARQVQLSPAHLALARRSAARCMVLLKNEGGLLPLGAGTGKVALIGPLAHDRGSMLGAWAIDGEKEDSQTLFEALEAVLPADSLLFAPDNLADDMLAVASQAGVVIVALGESLERSGENHNVSSIELPPGQEALLEALSRLGKPLVAVVTAGRPLDLSRVSALAQAVLWTWHAGSQGAEAAAEVLTGRAEPGGRLPVTFPRATGQIPIYYNFKSGGKNMDLQYRPLPPGYRHAERYLDLPSSPLYPFGFGLSYTTFTFSDLQVSPAQARSDQEVTVSALVSNTGPRAGETVAQLYLQDCVASVTRPVRELKCFARVALAPGESRALEFQLGWEELSFYGVDGKRVLEPGRFKVWLGADCRATLQGEFEITA